MSDFVITHHILHFNNEIFAPTTQLCSNILDWLGIELEIGNLFVPLFSNSTACINPFATAGHIYVTRQMSSTDRTTHIRASHSMLLNTIFRQRRSVVTQLRV